MRLNSCLSRAPPSGVRGRGLLQFGFVMGRIGGVGTSFSRVAEAIVLVTSVVLCSGANCAAADLKEEFRRVYAPYHTRIVDTYSRLRIVAEKQARVDSARLEAVERLEYRSNGPRMRIDFRDIRAGKNRNPGELQARVANPEDGSFAVRRDEGGPWVLLKMASGTNRFLESIRLNCPIATAPYSFHESDVLDFLGEPDASIISFQQFDEGGDKVAKVDFTYRVAAGKVWSGYFRFDAARSWVLDEWGYTSSRHKLTYNGSADGVPLIESFTSWVVPKESFEQPRERYVVREIKVAPADEADFRLAAFGIESGEYTGRTHLWALGMAAGVSLLLIGVYLRRRLERHKNSTT